MWLIVQILRPHVPAFLLPSQIVDDDDEDNDDADG